MRVTLAFVLAGGVVVFSGVVLSAKQCGKNQGKCDVQISDAMTNGVHGNGQNKDDRLISEGDTLAWSIRHVGPGASLNVTLDRFVDTTTNTASCPIDSVSGAGTSFTSSTCTVQIDLEHGSVRQPALKVKTGSGYPGHVFKFHLVVADSSNTNDIDPELQIDPAARSRFQIVVTTVVVLLLLPIGLIGFRAVRRRSAG
jgi:hypothetical protein